MEADSHTCVPLPHQGPAPLVRIYRTSDLRDVGTLEPPVTLGFTALAFSSDGKRLAVCTDEPDLALLVYQWEQVRRLNGEFDIRGVDSASLCMFCACPI